MRALLLAAVMAGPAWGAAAPARPTPEQAKLLRQSRSLADAGAKAWMAGRHADALASLETTLAIELRVVGPSHRRTEETAFRLGEALQLRGEWLRAEECRRLVLEARRRLHGDGHWRTADGCRELMEVLAQARWPAARREALRKVTKLQTQAMALYERKQPAKALPLAKEAVAIAEAALGEGHVLYADGLGALARIHQEVGEHEAALTVAKAALRARARIEGQSHPYYAGALLRLAEMHRAAGDIRQALPLHAQALAILKNAYGDDDPRYAIGFHNLGTFHIQAGDHRGALAHYRQALALFERHRGEGHPDYARCLKNLAATHETLGEYGHALPLRRRAAALCKEALGEGATGYADALAALAHVHHLKGDHRSALPLYEQARSIRKAALGERHPGYAASLNGLALVHLALGDHKTALPLAERAVVIARGALGVKNADHATALHNLADVHQARGDYAAALPLYKQALAIRKEVLGERHAMYANSLNNLAALLQDMGDNRAALHLYEKARVLIKGTLGERHASYATALHNLAFVHSAMGDYGRAEPLFRQALKIHEGAPGEGQAAHAATLDSLALLYERTGGREAALPLLIKSLALKKAALGVRHPHYALTLNHIAGLHRAAGRHEDALALYTEALAIIKEAQGERHPDHAMALHNLALLHREWGRHGEAIALFRRSLAGTRDAVGEGHPDYATGLHNLAELYSRMGRPGAALVLQEQALAFTRRRLALEASVQSERQQLAAAAALRHHLSARLGTPDEAASFSHGHVLSWKGASFAAQQARRLFLQAEADPTTRALSRELLDVTRSLALLVARTDAASRERAEELSRLKEEKEARLGELSEPFRASRRAPSSERFRASLPPGVVLVDLLAYHGVDPARPQEGQAWQRRLSAWVVRADAPTVRVGLGPLAHIEADITTWREALEKGRGPGPAPARLREAVWAPLEAHLGGATTVLISPDGALSGLPFAALPGSKPGKFLLEEVPLAVLPVPQVLPRLLLPARGGRSLLTLGGVDFGDRGGAWQELAATGREADAVTARFGGAFKGACLALSGAKATRAALREALPRARFAHLATHGFFAPPTMKSALDGGGKRPLGLMGRETLTGSHPGLLSGLVLAGANRPTPEDDGILTALEIAELDMSGMELAVLSACQTGLGKEAAGEGMLGLQRAFAVAGCRSVVSSLWSVHDAATAVLMERFYHHLWEKKLSKIEALRQAQLDVLRHPEWVEANVKGMRGTPGLRGVGKAAEVVISGRREKRSPVAWWGAWQLSGDWR